MPESGIGGVTWKKVFFKISQNSQETPLPEETPVNFAKFLSALFFTEQHRTIAYEIRRLQKRSERNRLPLLQKGECNGYCFGAAVIPEYEGSISPFSFYGYLPDY